MYLATQIRLEFDRQDKRSVAVSADLETLKAHCQSDADYVLNWKPFLDMWISQSTGTCYSGHHYLILEIPQV